jgi:hypothetical protein
MITLSNGNLYTMQGFYVNSNNGTLQATYQVSNAAAQALGFPTSNITLEMGGMPAIQETFASPLTVGLPLSPAYEQWLVSDHTNDGQTWLQFLTGGTIS